MRALVRNPMILLFSLTTFIFSCENETEIEEYSQEPDYKNKKDLHQKGSLNPRPLSSLDTQPSEANNYSENLRNIFGIAALEEVECQASEITPLLLQHLAKLITDPLAEDYFNRYLELSTRMAVMDKTDQYFGENGEYTNLVKRRIRELERFWNMPEQLRVVGQHNESLNDRDKLAYTFYYLMQDNSSWEMAYEAADEILELNALSPNLPESIFFSMDGFLNFNRTIIIGDGLVQLISETGIDPEVIYSSILAHEWAHQIQLDHFHLWYPGQDPRDQSRQNLHLELEADFFAAYFLTHKRGATYNWKKVEEFLAFFFQLGDCNTQNPTHHGTPDQRMRSSRFGYELANSMQKKGFILSPEEVHQAFLSYLPHILSP